MKQLGAAISSPPITPDPSIAASATAVTALSVSPALGQYAIIALAATFGALWTISRMDELTRWQAVKMFFRSVSIALVFTALIAHYVSKWLNYPVQELFGVVAFIIAWIGDRWLELRERGWQWLMSWRKTT